MNQVLSTIRPVYLVAKFFGFFATKLTEDGVKVTRIGFIYATVMSFALAAIIKYRYDLAISNPWYDSPLVFLGFKARQYFGIIGIALIFFGNFIYRESFMRILKTISQIDEKLSEIDLKFNYKTHKTFAIKVLIFLFLSFALMIFGTWAVIHVFGAKHTDVLLEVRVWGGLSLTVAVTGYYMVFYCVIVSGVKARFGKINEGLRRVVGMRVAQIEVKSMEKGLSDQPPNYSSLILMESHEKLPTKVKENSRKFKTPKHLEIIKENPKKPIKSIKKPLNHLTSTIQPLIQQVKPQPTNPTKLKSIKILTNLHLSLCETLKLINSLFLLANACFIALNLIAMIFVLFQIFVFARSAVKKSARQVNNILLSTFWNLFIAFKVAAVTWVCAATAQEGVKSERILGEILECELDVTVAGRVRTFRQQLRHVRPNFSCGLFEFDLGLICMFLETTITYLLVLIQFEMIFDPK